MPISVNTKKSPLFFSCFILFLFFAVPVLAEELPEKEFRMQGTATGQGQYFEITDSEYLNIKLKSSAAIKARIESAPEMVVLEVESVEGVEFSELILSGFQPDTTYHKYQDDYSNYEPVTTNGEGSFSYVQDIGKRHIIFIQPHKSTKFIRDDATGGDCASIGNWDASSKTCTLTQDVYETIQISRNITLNGNNYTIIGSGTGSCVFAISNNVNVKNITVANCYHGIYFDGVKQGSISFVNAMNNNIGIRLAYSNNITVSNNSAVENYFLGLGLYYSAHNVISNNAFGPGNSYGIQQAYTGNYNTYESNNISNNTNTGMYVYGWGGNYINFRNNKIEFNAYDGLIISSGYYHTLSGNSMLGNGFGGWNGKSNFSISGGDMDTNNIDKSNTVEGKPIYYEKNVTGKVYDESMDIGSFYCMNCNNITVKNLILTEHAAKVFLWRTDNSLVENITSRDNTAVVILDATSNNVVKNNNLDKIQMYHSDDSKVYGNNFWHVNSPVYIYGSSNLLFNMDVPIGGNYWKKHEVNCDDANNDGFCDAPFVFSGGRDDYPRVRAFEFKYEDDGNSTCLDDCFSSVLFLPGHQASRLYRKEWLGIENRLWEPNRNQDVRKLYLSPEDGTSIDPAIYTRDVIDEVFGFAHNIYKKFMLSMNGFVESGTINEWRAFPYDWRMPLEEIVDEGTRLEDGSVANVIEQIREMSESSKSGKVTLIGHSNGGLLGKMIIDRLEKSGEAELIDRLIMVGTPQLGTPKAIAGLLHGDGLSLGYGLLLDKKTARGFGENMVSAYNLMPSKKYFDIVQSPVVEFSEDVDKIYDFRALFGEVIDTWSDFKKFLLGDDGARTEPKESDTDSPNVLRDFILERSEKTHDLLDLWQAPEGMEVIQIAGWGLDTMSGIRYDKCGFIFCPNNLSNLKRELILTEDGDETVVVPSAVFMEGGERYYLDLKKNNDEKIINRSHASILEVEYVQDFIKNIVRGNKELDDYSSYVTLDKPEVKKEDKRLRYRLHSPVKLDIIDEYGNHTGIIEKSDPESDIRMYNQQVPNSYYMEFGETKYAGAEGSIAQKILLEGEDLGTFTFEIDEVFGTGEIKNTTFKNIPVMIGMKAEISIADSIGEMKIDIDGDGEIDIIIRPGEGISRETSLEVLEKIIRFMDIHEMTKDRLINKIENARKQYEKGHVVAGNAMLANVKHDIETFSKQNIPEELRIRNEEAEKLILIVERIININ